MVLHVLLDQYQHIANEPAQIAGFRRFVPRVRSQQSVVIRLARCPAARILSKALSRDSASLWRSPSFA